jgi:hypothetical protein
VEIVSGTTGSFSKTLTNLTPETTYYYRAFATNSEGTSMGEIKQFKTKSSIVITQPIVSSNAASLVTEISATLNGETLSDGGSTITQRGFYWSSTNTSPNSGDHVELVSGTTGSFNKIIENLTAGTTYYFRAFAINIKGTTKGDVKQFKTLPITVLEKLPFFDNFEETIVNDAIFSKWTTQNLEGWHYWHIIPGGGNGGQCMRFENTDVDQNDWLITKAIDCSNAVHLNVNFDVLYNGDGVKPKLFYKSLNKKDNSMSNWMELSYSLVPNENEWHSVDEIIIDNPGDIIYVAFQSEFAANQGIYFLLDNFSIESFTYVIPTVQTNNFNSVSFNSATVNGLISSYGGTEITHRGFYWSTSNTEPDSGDQVIIVSDTTNTFNTILENLTPETIYYYRAFATNSIGTALGEVKQFTTLKAIELPVIATKDATNIDHELAVINGEITSTGGASISECGFYWSSTNSNPERNNSFVEITENITNFSVELKNLTPGKIYYYRSFATNSAGTVLGEVKQFTTINTAAEINSVSQNEFKIYPNPITLNSVISFQIKTSENVDISVYDLQGRKIYTLLNKNLNPELHTIPVGNKIKVYGIYLCKLATSEEISTIKLIVNQ